MVVVSLFVNPAQFNDAGDLAAYPRDEERDAALAAEAGVDYLFAPPVEEVYPAGLRDDGRRSAALTETLEGAHRGRGHFDGVDHGRDEAAQHGRRRTSPTSARRTPSRRSSSAGCVRDLDIPVRIEVCPTVREPDGLALSSRNAAPVAERPRARHRAAPRARRRQAAVAAGERDRRGPARAAPSTSCSAAGASSPSTSSSSRRDTLEPVTPDRPRLLVVVAARSRRRPASSTTS